MCPFGVTPSCRTEASGTSVIDCNNEQKNAFPVQTASICKDRLRTNAVMLFAGVVARYTSGVEGTGPADMQVVAINGGVPHDATNGGENPNTGFGKGGVVVWLNEAFSTGQLEITSKDPSMDPTIEENMLSDPRDLERLRA